MWYVFQTMSGEEEVALQLCKQRVSKEFYKEMFIPRYVAKKKFRGEWHSVKKKLFPGYFFVDTDRIDDVLNDMTKVQRMTKVLRDADQISPITADEQKYLSDMMDENHVVPVSFGLIIGSKIVVTEGALQDYQGKICKIDRHRRIAKLETSLFGRNTPVEVSLEVVKKVTEEEFEDWKREQLENFSNMEELAEGEKQIEVGGMVKVVSGVFNNLIASVTHVDYKNMELKTMLELMGTKMPVTFRMDEVVAFEFDEDKED